MLEHSTSRSPDRRWLAWLAVSAGVVLLDQLSKHVMQQVLGPGQSIRVTPFFDLVLVFNPGAAFSFLSSAAGWQRELFIAIALAASVLIVYLLRKHAADRVFCFALGLILGGAIGNVIDRVREGAVTDFIKLPLGWPPFNLADSSITFGVVILFLVIDHSRHASR